MKKQYISSLFAFTSILSTNALADVAGEITFASEYLNQGFTQTAHNPALQGNIEWSDNSGWHVNAWASTMDMDGIDLEIDWVAGYTHSFNKTIDVDFGVTHYSYFGDSESSDSNYTEYYVSLDMQDWVVTNSWSFDVGGTSTTHTIIEAIYYYELSVGTLEFLVDHSYLLDDDEIEYDGDKSYTHWKVAYHYSPINNVKLIAAYDGTDYKSAYDPDSLAGDRLSVSVTYFF